MKRTMIASMCALHHRQTWIPLCFSLSSLVLSILSFPSLAGFFRVIRVAAALLAVAAVAAVLVGTSQEEENSALMETNLHYYLGDKQALSTEDARNQADSFFDDAAKKQGLRHAAVAKKKGLSDVAARQDLSSFFDTLGLNGDKNKEATTNENVNVKVTKQIEAAKKAPQVNIYINENHITKKQIIKQAAAEKKAAIKPVEKARKVPAAVPPFPVPPLICIRELPVLSNPRWRISQG